MDEDRRSALETLARLYRLTLDYLVETYKEELVRGGMAQEMDTETALAEWREAKRNPGMMAQLIDKYGDDFAKFANRMQRLERGQKDGT